MDPIEPYESLKRLYDQVDSHWDDRPLMPVRAESRTLPELFGQLLDMKTDVGRICLVVALLTVVGMFALKSVTLGMTGLIATTILGVVACRTMLEKKKGDPDAEVNHGTDKGPPGGGPAPSG